MFSQAGSKRGRPGYGFTLIELLLSVAVALLLVSAVVFSFSTLLAGSHLDEGLDQFENLIRLASAHASNTGRSVQMIFHEDVTESGLPVGSIALKWEPDPLGAPGIFEPLLEFDHAVQQANELIAVDSSRLGGPDAASGVLPGAELELTAGAEHSADAPAWLAAITFYADGAVDEAHVMLVSRDVDDSRRALVKIDGVTGAIRHQFLESATAESALAVENR